MRGPAYRRKPRHTTHLEDFPQAVTIIRRGHPFEGRSLQVLGRTHRAGRLHLLLILPDESRSLIPAAWTNLGSSANTIAESGGLNRTTLGALSDLLHARTVVDALLHRPPTREESHRATESAVPGCPQSKPRGVGATRREAPRSRPRETRSTDGKGRIVRSAKGGERP